MDLSRKERWLEAIEEQGLWPFTSRRIYRHYNGSDHAWQSRHHRKGLSVFEPLELLPLHVLIRLGLWMPKDLNWWIGVIFAFGSALFAAGSVRVIGTSLGGLQFSDPNVAFMISAFFAFVPKEAFHFNAALISVLFTLLGAVGFLAGSLLMLPEASDAASHGSSSAP